jgi:CheY-like chemotaxis protein
VADLEVFADGDRIIQALTNLIGNAIKFSPAGSTITVRVFREGGDAHVFVMDQGRGIPPAKLASIFDRFQQVDASDARELGGTGLGLAICRGIVEQHGGKIWVESTEGEGSTFHFTIPLALSSDVNVTTPTHRSSGGAKAVAGQAPVILVIEDDMSLAQVLAVTLEGQGFRVERAHTAADALSRLKGIAPALVVADLMLPDASGLELIHRLRGMKDVCGCPVVVYTADDLSAPDREVLREHSVELVMKARSSPEQLAMRVRQILSS